MHYHILIEGFIPAFLVSPIFDPVIDILFVVGFYPADKKGDWAGVYFGNFDLKLTKLLEAFYGFTDKIGEFYYDGNLEDFDYAETAISSS